MLFFSLPKAKTQEDLFHETKTKEKIKNALYKVCMYVVVFFLIIEEYKLERNTIFMRRETNKRFYFIFIN